MSQVILKSLEQIEEGVDSLLTKQREHADRLLSLEQSGTAPRYENTVKTGKLSDSVIKAFNENAELIQKSAHVRLEVKAAGDALTTGDARSVMSVGVGMPTGAPLGVFNAMPQRSIGPTSAVEYSRFLALEGAAAKQASEGAAKAAVRPTFSLISQTAATIAGYSKISKQAMTDSAELKAAIDNTLVRSIGTAMDSFLASSAWGGANGLLAHATAYTSLVYTGIADAVSEGVATMQTAGFNPDVVCLTPADWLGVLVAKGTANDHYLSGNYIGAMPQTLRGLRVVLSPSITAGKALLMDSAQFELLICDALTIEIGTDGNDFTTNVRTILGEMRVIPTFRATGAGRLITPKA
jgi:HK97 family phage major capsid protein